jgi:hypothetical protein
MNRRKMTLNEEINQMKKLFGHMNMPLLIREAIGGGGGGKAGVLAALDSGSSMARYVGVGVAKEIEDAIVLAARNSDAITKALGRQVTTFAELEAGYPGISKSDIGLKVLNQIELSSAKTLMFNLSEKLGPVNLNNLKINMTELMAPEVQSLKTSLSEVQTTVKNLYADPTTAEAAAELTPALITKIRGSIDGISETSMQAATKKSLLETLDGIEAQANTVLFKPVANEVADVDLAKIFPDNPEIVSSYNKSTSIQRKIAEDALQGMDSEKQFALLTKFVSDYESGSLPPFNAQVTKEDIKGYADLAPKILKTWSKSGKSAPGGCFNFFLTLLIASVGIGVLIWYNQWDAEIKIPDVNPFNDTKEVKCCSDVVGYSELNEDQQKYVVLTFGCARTKDDNSEDKVIGFGIDSKRNLMVKYRKNCTEKYEVQTGGLNATLVGPSCDNKITTKKYSCNGVDCVEDPNGTYDESTCGGNCGGTTVPPAYSNDEPGFKKWVLANKYTNENFDGLWYRDNGDDFQAEYNVTDGTWQKKN